MLKNTDIFKNIKADYRLSRRGISLIVLIITIIVIIILAGSVILSLNNTNIISNANKGVNSQNKNTIISAYDLLLADYFVDRSKDTPVGIEITLSALAERVGVTEADLQDRFKINNDGDLCELQGDQWVILATKPDDGK